MPPKLLRANKLLGRKPAYIKKRACIVSKSQFGYTTSFDIYTTLNVLYSLAMANFLLKSYFFMPVQRIRVMMQPITIICLLQHLRSWGTNRRRHVSPQSFRPVKTCSKYNTIILILDPPQCIAI